MKIRFATASAAILCFLFAIGLSPAISCAEESDIDSAVIVEKEFQ